MQILTDCQHHTLIPPHNSGTNAVPASVHSTIATQETIQVEESEICAKGHSVSALNSIVKREYLPIWTCLGIYLYAQNPLSGK